MTIPESQLKTWSNQGATVTSQNTYNSIKTALESYSWSSGVKYDIYLQGSYRNFTNIYANSDVDIVVELNSIFYSNLTEEENQRLGFENSNYSLKEFRSEVMRALIGYYGSDQIDISGSKSIKVLPSSNRLKADIIIACNYKYFSNLNCIAEGIKFFTLPAYQEIINYPNLHFLKGANKNSDTNNWYKPTIRLFKNMREQLVTSNPSLRGLYPSFFIENLLFNNPNSCFGINFQKTTYEILNWLDKNLIPGNQGKFVCQSEMFYLFGNLSTLWKYENAIDFKNKMIGLWNNY